MGGGSWTASDWNDRSTSFKSKSVKETFKVDRVLPDWNPLNIKIRESRDSDSSPNSTPIIIALDVTGSMGMIPKYMVDTGFGIVMKEIFDRNTIPNPHIMTMAVGDVRSDDGPLQVTQFEADIRIVDQLTNLWLESGGGGNNTESYDFPWYFAATRTSVDSFEKRGKKGYLFTIGDEESPAGLPGELLKEFMGDDLTETVSAKMALEMAERMYNVFHIIVEQGSHAQRYLSRVQESWKQLLGQRVLSVSDYTKISEVIISTIELIEGSDYDKVVNSWDGKTSAVVAHATRGLKTTSGNTTPGLVIL